MIICYRLFILNGEFSVFDELFENIMIIIKDDKDIRMVYCVIGCVLYQKQNVEIYFDFR